MSSWTLAGLAGLTALLLDAKPAFAYIDPGTGSFLFQTISAGVIGGIFLVRRFWGQVREGVGRLFGRRRDV